MFGKASTFKGGYNYRFILNHDVSTTGMICSDDDSEWPTGHKGSSFVSGTSFSSLFFWIIAQLLVYLSSRIIVNGLWTRVHL